MEGRTLLAVDIPEDFYEVLGIEETDIYGSVSYICLDTLAAEGGNISFIFLFTNESYHYEGDGDDSFEKEVSGLPLGVFSRLLHSATTAEREYAVRKERREIRDKIISLFLGQVK